jgi:hypothetical protein
VLAEFEGLRKLPLLSTRAAAAPDVRYRRRERVCDSIMSRNQHPKRLTNPKSRASRNSYNKHPAMTTANKINSSGWVERRTSCSTTAAHSSLPPHSHPSRPRDRYAIRCRSLRHRWQILQASARRRGIDVSISLHLFCVLVKHVCAFCGVSLWEQCGYDSYTWCDTVVLIDSSSYARVDQHTFTVTIITSRTDKHPCSFMVAGQVVEF